MSHNKELKRPAKHDYRCPTCGARRGLSLTPKDVQTIRALLTNGAPQAELARAYGVTKQAINRINTKKSWRDL